MNVIQPGQIFIRRGHILLAGDGIVIVVAIVNDEVVTMRADMSMYVLPIQKINLWIRHEIWKLIS